MKNSRLISLCIALVTLFLVVALLSVLKSCTGGKKTENGVNAFEAHKTNSVISFDREGDHGIFHIHK